MEAKSEKKWATEIRGIHIYVGIKYVGITVLITFDPIEKLWMVRKKDDTLLKTYDSGVPTEKENQRFCTIVSCEGIMKNDTTLCRFIVHIFMSQAIPLKGDSALVKRKIVPIKLSSTFQYK